MSGGASAWRWFPHALIGSLLIVFLVNGVMIYFALHSFPGSAGEDGFDLGRSYDHILDGEARQRALGWTAALSVDAEQRPILHLTGPGREALIGASVHAIAARPVGPEDAHPVEFVPQGDRLVAKLPLPPGQWSVTLDIQRASDRLTTTERLVVR